jgi:hypothetical protein
MPPYTVSSSRVLSFGDLAQARQGSGVLETRHRWQARDEMLAPHCGGATMYPLTQPSAAASNTVQVGTAGNSTAACRVVAREPRCSHSPSPQLQAGGNSNAGCSGVGLLIQRLATIQLPVANLASSEHTLGEMRLDTGNAAYPAANSFFMSVLRHASTHDFAVQHLVQATAAMYTAALSALSVALWGLRAAQSLLSQVRQRCINCAYLRWWTSTLALQDLPASSNCTCLAATCQWACK